MTTADLQARLDAIAPVLGITQAEERLALLREASEAPGLWEDQERAVEVMGELAALEKLITEWENVTELLEMAGELKEEDLITLEADVRHLEQRALLAGPHDQANAILTIHAGTGGTDAQDWAEMLERMYLRFIEQGKTEEENDRVLGIERKWNASIIDRSAGEEAGIKSVTIQVTGPYAYGLLKAEAGVHRLVRLSPFNAKNLRQTSFALIEVIPMLDRGTKVDIKETDLDIDVFRSGGAGGQHVNTTDSAVRLTHKPTGLVVVVQNERSQHQNKATAMGILAAKLARLEELKTAEELAMLKGEFREGTWGNQIRSYVMQPYQMVKDHRTDTETSNVQAVLDGALKPFIESELIRTNHGE